MLGPSLSADITRIGTWRILGSAWSHRATSSPDAAGMTRSSNTTSGPNPRIASNKGSFFAWANGHDPVADRLEDELTHLQEVVLVVDHQNPVHCSLR
jgi:hypothetical protein